MVARRDREQGKLSCHALVIVTYLPPHPQLTFAHLYPELRAVIIDAIKDSFPEDSFFDSYMPVKWLLKLSDMQLKTIMEENDVVWDEIPQHLQAIKNAHPELVLDEGTPSERAIVDTIRFLKQERLPSSLLGRWQFPLPDIEVFRAPNMFPQKVVVRAEAVVKQNV
jgi:hypothetical protein